MGERIKRYVVCSSLPSKLPIGQFGLQFATKTCYKCHICIQKTEFKHAWNVLGEFQLIARETDF